MLLSNQSIANFKHEMAGWAQVPLSELGFQQARALSPYRHDIRFDMVFSSDLLRAVQTAQEASAVDPEFNVLSNMGISSWQAISIRISQHTERRIKR